MTSYNWITSCLKLFSITLEDLCDSFSFLQWNFLTMSQREKLVSSKISDLSYDVIRTKIFEETYFSFHFIVLTIDREYTSKKRSIMMRVTVELDFFFGKFVNSLTR